MVRRWRLIALALVGGLVLAFPSSGSALAAVFIALTPSGPSPASLTLGMLGYPLWENQDTVTHTVTFDNGLCSFQVAPGGMGQCEVRWRAGTYSYTVDGTMQASITFELDARTVTLWARHHTIRSGAPLILHGALAAAHPLPGPSLQPITLLARHGRHHAFRRIAVVRPRSEVGRGQLAIWRLRVRARTGTTIYIAKAKYLPGIWQIATSKPFKVVVRARR